VDPAVIRAFTDLGTVGLLIGVLIGGHKGWWIFGPLHDRIVTDLVEQRNFWREQALRSTSLSERAVEVVTKRAPDAG